MLRIRLAPRPGDTYLSDNALTGRGLMFKGLGGLADMGKMMKAAQEMQGKMAQMQEDLATMTVTGESGAGLAGAQVYVQGTAVGALSASDGSFTLPQMAVLRKPCLNAI